MKRDIRFGVRDQIAEVEKVEDAPLDVQFPRHIRSRESELAGGVEDAAQSIGAP
jgi:hypothetical protein